MKAEIISVGTELLLGEIVDTNSHFLAGELASLGIDLYFTSSVGDNHDRLLAVLQKAWQRSELILTTGGLGPTQDDLTRDAIASLVGEKQAEDPALRQYIANFFAQRGLEMPQSNARQANLIPSAKAIMNSRGTAPGWWVEKDGRIIIAMPGPPGEMNFMWQQEVSPALQKRRSAVIISRTIKTFGLSESRVDEMLSPVMSSSNPTMATYAKQDGIHLRITAKTAQPEEAKEVIAKRETDVRASLGDYIWGADNDTFDGVIGQLLMDRKLSLAVVESFTEGFLMNIISGAPEVQRYFKGGIMATSDEVKITLGIEPGTLAEGDGSKTALAMASLARKKFNSDIGIGIDGHTEAADGTELDRVFIAIEDGRTGKTAAQGYSGRHPHMKRRAAYQALFDLRKFLGTA